MLSAPMVMPQTLVQGYPASSYVNQPALRPAAAPPWQPPYQGTVADQPPRRQPVIRLQASDDPSPLPPRTRPAPAAPLHLPSPEELGIAGSRPAGDATIDWADVHRRLDRLGALSFQQQKFQEGCFRVTFLLPRRQGNRSQLVRAEAATLAQAVGLALERAEK